MVNYNISHVSACIQNYKKVVLEENILKKKQKQP